MNEKENAIYKLLDITVKCTATKVDDKGTMSLTREDIKGKSRCENAVMARCIFICLLLHYGYSITTCALILKRTVPAIRHLERLSDNYLKTSVAYRIAMAEATLMARDENVLSK